MSRVQSVRDDVLSLRPRRQRDQRVQSVEPYRAGTDGPFDFDRANRLLSRVGCGASSRGIEAAVEQGLEATLDQLFEENENPESSAQAASLLRGGDLTAAQAWWLSELCSGFAMARERMALFWHGHFATSVRKPLPLALAVRQAELFRGRSMGRFDGLLLDVVRDPAMIIWLDASQSIVGNANENLAREVLELFTLGHGQYEQQDVRELARALTGWDVDIDRAVFRDSLHDHRPARILGTAGIVGYEQALRTITAQPSCAHFIVGKIWRHIFGQAPDSETWTRIASEFERDGLHVGRCLRRLVSSRAFLQPARLPERIASPVELLVVFARRLEAAPDWRRWASAAASMGQSLLAPPSVAGWPSGTNWLASTWCLRRAEMSTMILSGVERLRIPSCTWAVDLVTRVFCNDDRQREVVRRVAARQSALPPARLLAALLALPEAQTL